MPNLCCTQPQAVRRPKSASRNRAPAARSTLRIASRAFSIRNSPSLLAADLLQVAVAQAQLPAGVDHLGQRLPVPLARLGLVGQVLFDGVEDLAFGHPLGLVLGVAAAAVWKSMPRKSRASSSTPSSLAGPFGEGLGAVVLGEELVEVAGRSAGRSSPGSAACSWRRRGSAGGSRRRACAARPSPRRIRAGSCGCRSCALRPSSGRLRCGGETMRLSMASPSCMPRRVSMFLTHSPAKIRIRSSSSER